MQANYGFLTVKEFEKRFKMQPKVLGAKVQKLMNEEGTREISGVLFKIQGPEDMTYRTVQFF